MESQSNEIIQIGFFQPEDLECVLEGAASVDAGDASAETLNAFAANPNNFLVIARTKEQLVGIASGYFLTEIDGAQTMFLYELDVAPDFRQQGVATRIIEFLRTEAGRTNRVLWVVSSQENQAAMALYENTGAQRTNGQAVVWEYPN